MVTPAQSAGGNPDDWKYGHDHGGPKDGERSISGRACLPLLVAMIGIVTVITAGLGFVIMVVVA